MPVRRTALAAVAALVLSVLVGLTSTPAHADPDPGVALPPGPDGATPSRLALTDGEVWAVWTTPDGAQTLYRTTDDGTGSWEVVDDPETGQPVTGTVRSWDGVVLSFRTDPQNSRCTITRVASPAGVWETPPGACRVSPTVGAGGRLLRFSDGKAPPSMTVYQAADGTPVEGVDPTSRPATVGSWVWSVTSGALVGHDASGALPDRYVSLPSDCLNLGARAITSVTPDQQWALVDCSAADLVVPLTSERAPLRLPLGSPTDSLGNGFTYGRVFDGTTGEIVVRDLSAELVSHVYGPAGAVVASDEGAPRLAWIQGGTTVHVAHLDWLGSAPAASADTTPPTIDSTDGSPAVVAGGSSRPDLSFRWSATDNWAGPLYSDVDVAYDGPDGTFYPYTHTYASSIMAHTGVGPGDVCFRVRASDRVGNRSAWSAPRCTWIDARRPDMNDGVGGSPLLRVLRRLGPQQVTYRFHGDDDTFVASYDVEQRLAKADRDLGSWWPTSSRVTTSSVTAVVRSGQERCFRARARDGVDRLSGYGDRSCVVSPYDDRSFVVRGGHLGHADWAIGGTVTVLTSGRDALVHRHLVGRDVWVRMTSSSGGCPRLWWGGEEVMRDICRQDGHWYHVMRPHRHRGTVRVAGIPGAVTRVDAVAVVR